IRIEGASGMSKDEVEKKEKEKADQVCNSVGTQGFDLIGNRKERKRLNLIAGRRKRQTWYGFFHAMKVNLVTPP
ncbi:MAG: hypothetical protein J0H24_14690, partial [Delftia acidovorans]|nr:hypothetical protein [Delftia acidovorans]